MLDPAPLPEDHRGGAVPGGGRARCAASWARPRSRRARPSATWARAPSSSCSTAAASSTSSKSTPGCRWSTRSPSWSPASTWSRLQLLVAEGQPLPDEVRFATLTGHAIEARLYAEDAAAISGPPPAPCTRSPSPTGPGCGWTPASPRARRSACTTTRCWPRSSRTVPPATQACRRLARALAEHQAARRGQQPRPAGRHPAPAGVPGRPVRHRLPGPARPAPAGHVRPGPGRAPAARAGRRAGRAGRPARGRPGAGHDPLRLAQRAGRAAAGHVRLRRAAAGRALPSRPRRR